MSRPVCVSIGLPVFNAGRYLRSALDATLGQTFDDFELIISDNASTDDTPAICEEYARTDSRIRLLRQPQNCGVNANHLNVFRDAQGEYFRWASADDVPAVELLEHAVGTMRENQGLVAYVPDTVNIDAAGRRLRRLPRTLDLRSNRAYERAEAVLTRGYQMVFPQGLMRRSTLIETSCNWNYFGWDFILLFELALRGHLSNIEGPLLRRRVHDESAALATRKVSEVRKWVDPTIGSRILLPHWRWTSERFRSVLRAPIPQAERARVMGLVLRHTWWTRRSLGRDLVMATKLKLGKTDDYPF